MLTLNIDFFIVLLININLRDLYNQNIIVLTCNPKTVLSEYRLVFESKGRNADFKIFQNLFRWGTNPGPHACEASVITTTVRDRLDDAMLTCKMTKNS